MNYAGRRALVVGLGDTGLACVRWLLRHGAQLRAVDTRAQAPHAERLRTEHPEVAITLGPLDASDFAWADLIVVSPGVPLTTPEIAQAAAAGKEVVGDVELFARALAQLAPLSPHPSRILAITGSNGKSTVTALTGHLCRQAGKSTVVAGNIGYPVLDALSAAEAAGSLPEVWVLELSSFQLESTASLAPDAATVLNLSEDHMDRYAGMAEYAAAKARIFGPLTSPLAPDAVAPLRTQVLNRDDPLVMKMVRPGWRLWTFGLGLGLHAGEWGLTERGHEKWLAEGTQPLLPLSELPLVGLHNAANALAALALARAIDLPYAPLLEGLATFEGLPHRVQKVAEIDGVVWYDDSKGTNVGATVAALTGLDRPVVLIAGGDGKGQDFSPLREAMGRVRCVILIGRDAARIEAAIAGAARCLHAGSLEEAVTLAHAEARAGDAVLLSPACASFDMFRNYVHRAEVYVAAVRALSSPTHSGGRDVP
ncbi:MAG: UDP-N-acetylmuramoyl-L-alanine--D-glutamate ligase [Thiobacillaceae bacterium]|nr:UDP-N-acetylmuramoyl-L-alanine--D-glutamate ligase [Thiobacillaceae bacterium]MCX7672905.1 UDP-N-acetylmuramoyl-L-alanine--D-glutamate ligase [Thiobacillaceae bacterium]